MYNTHEHSRLTLLEWDTSVRCPWPHLPWAPPLRPPPCSQSRPGDHWPTQSSTSTGTPEPRFSTVCSRLPAKVVWGGHRERQRWSGDDGQLCRSYRRPLGAWPESGHRSESGETHQIAGNTHSTSWKYKFMQFLFMRSSVLCIVTYSVIKIYMYMYMYMYMYVVQIYTTCARFA